MAEHEPVPSAEAGARPDFVRMALGTLVVLLVGVIVLMYYGMRDGAGAAGAPAASVAAPVGRVVNLPIVNAHDHLFRLQDLPKYLEAADTLGIAKTLFVASSDFTLKGESFSPVEGTDWNSREILQAARDYPGKIIPFVTFHPDNANKLQLLQEYVAEGAQGVKLYTGHGSFHDRPLLTPEMAPVYAYCEEIGLPICWHINLNNYAGEFREVLAEYPNLKVILPHFGVGFYNPGGPVMEDLAALLDAYPNLYVDTSFGTREILVSGMERVHANPEFFQDFYARYQDRIVWGTDMVVTGHREKTTPWIASVIRACRDLHEKESYHFWMAADGAPYAFARTQNPYGMLRGLNLPEPILEKIYVSNIERILARGE